MLFDWMTTAGDHIQKSLLFGDLRVSFISCMNCNSFASHVAPFGTVSRVGHPRGDGHHCRSLSRSHMHPALHVSQLPEQQNKVTMPSKRRWAMLLTHGCKSRICLLLVQLSFRCLRSCAGRCLGAWFLLQQTFTTKGEAAPCCRACQSVTTATSWRR